MIGLLEKKKQKQTKNKLNLFKKQLKAPES